MELHLLDTHSATSDTADAAECDIPKVCFLSSGILDLLKSKLGAMFAHKDTENSRTQPCLLLTVLFKTAAPLKAQPHKSVFFKH